MAHDTAPSSDSLRAAARAFVVTVFGLVARRAQPAPSVQAPGWHWVRGTEGWFFLEANQSHWWRDPLIHVQDEFGSLPEYALLVQLFNEDPGLAQLPRAILGTEATSSRMETRELLRELLWRVADRSGDGALDIRPFDEIYDAWHSDLSAATVRETWVAPLLGLWGPSQPIALTPDIRIAPLEDAEISHFLGLRMLPSGDMSMFNASVARVPETVYGLRIVFEAEGKVPAKLPDPRDSPRWRASNDLFEDVIIALRVFKSERVASPGMAVFKSWPHDGSIFFSALGDVGQSNPYERMVYALADDEAPAFQEFFGAYQKAKKELGFAARRFAYASERIRAEDRITDLMIASEALFLGKKDGELRHRLALRAACFLHPEYPTRATMLRFFRNAYDVRSKIVHGSPLDNAKLVGVDGAACAGPRGFADVLEDVLRGALRKATMQTAMRGAFMSDEDWDALILRDPAS